MQPRIAIPLPLSRDPEYVERALPQYEQAARMAGGEPVRVPLDKLPAEVMKIIERCDAVLLPGSGADVDPSKYGAQRHPKTNDPDPKRDTVDELLLQDAYNMRKPVLAICYGLQILNVYCTGSLIQHIESTVNHAAGRKVPIAHSVAIEPASRLARIVVSANLEEPASGRDTSPASREGHDFSRAAAIAPHSGALAPEGTNLVIPVNSSHHQAADVVGDGLRVVARCPEDGIIEALESVSPDHFVLAVQWHPERSANDDQRSRSIFRALVEAARLVHGRLRGEFESV